MNTVQCLIQQTNCGLSTQDPVCAKCGIDTRVRYVSEEAALLAKAQAQARYWQSEAEGYKAKVQQSLSSIPQVEAAVGGEDSRRPVPTRDIEIRVPYIGDYFSDVPVIAVLVRAGDTIKAKQILIEVENDKAIMEIPSSHAGVVSELRVMCGDKVSEGTVILLLASEGPH